MIVGLTDTQYILQVWREEDVEITRWKGWRVQKSNCNMCHLHCSIYLDVLVNYQPIFLDFFSPREGGRPNCEAMVVTTFAYICFYSTSFTKRFLRNLFSGVTMVFVTDVTAFNLLYHTYIVFMGLNKPLSGQMVSVYTHRWDNYIKTHFQQTLKKLEANKSFSLNFFKSAIETIAQHSEYKYRTINTNKQNKVGQFRTFHAFAIYFTLFICSDG